MVRNGVDGPQNLYKGLMSVAYGKALGWGGLLQYVHFDVADGCVC